MYARFVVMCTILPSEILITAWMQAPHLRACLMIGYARCVELTKTVLNRNERHPRTYASAVAISAMQPAVCHDGE